MIIFGASLEQWLFIISLSIPFAILFTLLNNWINKREQLNKLGEKK